MGFNVFRAVIAANATAAIVPIPGHFNDAGIIERTRSAHDAYWSARAVFAPERLRARASAQIAHSAGEQAKIG